MWLAVACYGVGTGRDGHGLARTGSGWQDKDILIPLGSARRGLAGSGAGVVGTGRTRMGGALAGIGEARVYSYHVDWSGGAWLRPGGDRPGTGAVGQGKGNAQITTT